MQNTSLEYQKQIRKPIRNPSHMKISLDLTDPNIVEDTVLQAPTGLDFSNINDVVTQFDIIPRYPTLEPNRLILNGKAVLPDKNKDYSKQGYLGMPISDAEGKFQAPIVVTITFGDKYYSSKGLTFTFDTEYNSYPKSVRVVAYNDNDIIVDGIQNPSRVDDWLFDTDIQICNKIIITFTDCNMPFTRFRLENILFGKREEFESDIIVDSSWKRSIDLVNAKLPSYSFDFTILDVNKDFNPENPKGIYSYLSDKQSVVFNYGYELDNGSIEWIKGAEMLTTGENNIDTQSVISQITFKTKSILSLLENEYKLGLYRSTPISLYDLAIEVLESSNLPLRRGEKPWRIDESLQNIYTNAPLPKQPINVLLQMIANAGMCVLQVDRDGIIRIEPEPITISTGELTLADMYTPPNVKRYPPLSGVDTGVNILVPEDTITKLVDKDLVAGFGTVYEFEYEDSTNVTAEVSGGLSIVGEPKYYSHYCIIKLTGTGKLTINGNKLVSSTLVVSLENEHIGARCPSINELITTEANANNYAEWIRKYATRNYDYEIENRGFPELDMDNIQFDSNFSNGNYGTIYYMEINYNGALSSLTRVLTANSTFNKMFDATGTFRAGQSLRLPTMSRS